MSAGELRRTITKPARQSGYDFESGLVDTLLDDAGAEPGALPLLSHAMLETWRRPEGQTLTLRGYAASGGLRGAMAQPLDGPSKGHLRAARPKKGHFCPDGRARVRRTRARRPSHGPSKGPLSPGACSWP